MRLDIGAVLSVEDAVASKVTVLYGRGEARDFLDVDAIRASAQFSDAALLAAAATSSPTSTFANSSTSCRAAGD